MQYQATLSFAKQADQTDPIGAYQDKFFLPTGLARDGKTVTYLVGNSLGLQPRKASDFVEDEMERWSKFGIEGYWLGKENKWLEYNQTLNPALARMLGAKESEVITTGGLTANIHLLMASFYRPKGKRVKIIMEAGAFPSDRYAVASQIRWHGLDPAEVLIELQPDAEGYLLSMDRVLETIKAHAKEVALVLMPGVQYYTGQLFDMAAIAAAARKAGAVMGLDLAHAVGNVPMKLHDWGVDFAVWCSYKYLNGGPGAPAGLFVHDQHGQDLSTPRLSGWWGNDISTRFDMDKPFMPTPGAQGWQLTNVPILSTAPLRASLKMFQEVGIDALRERSKKLTGYLAFLIQRADPEARVMEIISPQDPEARGCQLSLAVHQGFGKPIYEALKAASVICDWRDNPSGQGPGIIRMAPAPFYNTYIDLLRAGETLRVVYEALARQKESKV